MSNSGRSRRAPPPSREEVVQGLLAERRELMVANERLRLELDELRGKARGDPRVPRLEAEVSRLRAALEEARAERDRLDAGVREALRQLRQK
jgi:hypothetical protein